MARDLIGGARGLHSQLFDLGCHHGEAFAGGPSPSGLDRGVEREQIGLTGNTADDIRDRANPIDLFAKRRDGFPCGTASDHRLADHGGGFIDLGRYFANRRGQLFGRARDRLAVVQCLLRGAQCRTGRGFRASRCKFHTSRVVGHRLGVPTDLIHRCGGLIFYLVRHVAERRGQEIRKLGLLFLVRDPLGLDPRYIFRDGILHAGQRRQQAGCFAASPGVDRIVQFSTRDRDCYRDAPTHGASDGCTDGQADQHRDRDR